MAKKGTKKGAKKSPKNGQHMMPGMPKKGMSKKSCM
jgi:hypothetical protein